MHVVIHITWRMCKKELDRESQRNYLYRSTNIYLYKIATIYIEIKEVVYSQFHLIECYI